ncbi:ATP-binding protein [Anoxynatronum buryatiense]|uniref:4Fe-4S binding domain-containing protein n=1 Tax=Anoxynatronum buryatiense TaxID=489973 RepID=A0AA46AKA3_9CLOT|nr:4Fe-4S dicluster domain-containing protein [Anoxynatronum buryatiense]SMP67770.1 4Fe-4S binding domain-containing protein [Anoxynatronum buryatiense]
MNRKIIEINEALCNGCELCVTACHEGAIEMVDGKARLISDVYCDGLGDCLPECPTGAIKMIEREAAPYDEALVMQRISEREAREAAVVKETAPAGSPCGCPGMAAKAIQRDHTTSTASSSHESYEQVHADHHQAPSELSQWPVQLNLVHPQAPYLQGADILIAADCTAYAYGDFHRDFIKGKITLIGCPKLDDNQHYQEKLTEIFRLNNPKSITVTRMQVPCCGGIVSAVRQAMLAAQVIVPYREVTIGTDGTLLQG